MVGSRYVGEGKLSLEKFEIVGSDVQDNKEPEVKTNANDDNNNNKEIVEELLSKIEGQNKEIEQLKADNDKLKQQTKQQSEVHCVEG